MLVLVVVAVVFVRSCELYIDTYVSAHIDKQHTIRNQSSHMAQGSYLMCCVWLCTVYCICHIVRGWKSANERSVARVCNIFVHRHHFISFTSHKSPRPSVLLEFDFHGIKTLAKTNVWLYFVFHHHRRLHVNLVLIVQKSCCAYCFSSSICVCVCACVFVRECVSVRSPEYSIQQLFNRIFIP